MIKNSTTESTGKQLDWYDDIDQIRPLIPEDDDDAITEAALGKKLATGVMAASVALNGSNTTGTLPNDTAHRSHRETVVAQKPKEFGQSEQHDKNPNLTIPDKKRSVDNINTPQYPAGTVISIPLSDFGKPASDFSTNESIKMYRQLEYIASIKGGNSDVLKKTVVIVSIVDPSDTVEMEKIKEQNSTTSFTSGLTLHKEIPTIFVTSIPIPNTKSLANLLSHELKHPFPYIAATILSSLSKAQDPSYAAYQAYSKKLDNTEHIKKEQHVWSIEGGPFNALTASVETKCIILPNVKTQH